MFAHLIPRVQQILEIPVPLPPTSYRFGASWNIFRLFFNFQIKKYVHSSVKTIPKSGIKYLPLLYAASQIWKIFKVVPLNNFLKLNTYILFVFFKEFPRFRSFVGGEGGCPTLLTLVVRIQLCKIFRAVVAIYRADYWRILWIL